LILIRTYKQKKNTYTSRSSQVKKRLNIINTKVFYLILFDFYLFDVRSKKKREEKEEKNIF